MKRIAVIGAGITGLAAAFELKRRDIEVVVFEASDRVGGCVSTLKTDGYLVERGPNSILDTHPNLGTLIARLGIAGNKLPANTSAQNRFIVRDGEPIALPTSPPSFFTSSAFSAKAKFRLLKEPFIKSTSNEQESLADFVLRRLGREFLDYAINPFVSGVYAGRPEDLSVAHAFPKLYALEQEHGSLIKGAIKGAKARKRRTETASKDARMFTFDDGMEVLTDTLAAKLDGAVRLNTPITSIAQGEAGWTVNSESFTDVVIAIPAYQQTELNTPFDLTMMSEIYYPPVATVSLGLSVNDLGHRLNGFGMLIPEVENQFSLGALFPSSIFPDRAPGGMALLTVFVGGARAPDRALLNENEIVLKVLADLRELLDVDGEPDFVNVSVWPRAIPQYVVGYEKYLNHMKSIETDFQGIHFAGHYRDGISVSNSILSGIDVAERLSDESSTQRSQER